MRIIMAKKKKQIKKLVLGKWKATTNRNNTWHVFYDKAHYARVFMNGQRRVEFKKNVPIRKVYYLSRFLLMLIRKIK